MTDISQQHRRHDANLAALWSVYAGTPEGRFFRAGRDIGAVSGVSLSLFNPAVLTDAHPDDLEDLFQWMTEQTRPREIGSLWWLGAEAQDDRVCNRLEALGLEPAGSTPAMERDLDGFTPAPLPQGVTIETVTGIEARADWANFMTRAFGFPDSMAADIAQLETGLPEASLTGQHRYLARFEGEPAATGFLMMDDNGLAGLYCIATSEDMRRRGIGGAVTEHAMADAKSQGADRVVLQASSMGAPVYERLGFRTTFDYRNYALSP